MKDRIKNISIVALILVLLYQAVLIRSKNGIIDKMADDHATMHLLVERCEAAQR